MESVTEKFLKYVKVDTQSDELSETFPSTKKQFNLAGMLVEELKNMGVSDVYFDEKYCYVYAKIPANTEKTNYTGNADSICVPETTGIGFISHMDTSPEVSGEGVNPKIVKNYDGKDIFLGEENGRKYVLSPAVFPELKDYIGKDLVTTDGKTLLGADDKAGVAEIMAMAEYFLDNPQIKHPDIYIAFTPDEEVGGGMDHFDVKRFGAKYAYTVDGGGIGELEYENFNAASAVIEFTGQSVHPGEAKDKMVNASRLAIEFDAQIPENERPEYTSGYEGFYHLTDMQGSVEHAVLKYILRDHDRDLFEKKKDIIKKAAESINMEYGEGTASYVIKDQYYNMKEKLEDAMFLIEDAKNAMEELGIVPKINPIRGGTDGARLSYMGVPCPNICTGGHNYHGRYEYCCIQSMEKITELLIKLAKRGE